MIGDSFSHWPLKHHLFCQARRNGLQAGRLFGQLPRVDPDALWKVEWSVADLRGALIGVLPTNEFHAQHSPV